MVVAMHKAGGIDNIAVAASYIEQLIKRKESKATVAETRRPNFQADNDWYNDDTDVNAPIKKNRSRGDPTEWEVQVGDSYYIMDDDEYARFSKHMANRRKGPRSFTVDYAPENAKRVNFLDETSSQPGESTTLVIVERFTELLRQQEEMTALIYESLKPTPSNPSKSTASPRLLPRRSTTKQNIPLSSSTQDCEQSTSPEPLPQP